MDNRYESEQMARYHEAQDLYTICDLQVKNINAFFKKFGPDAPAAIEMQTMRLAAEKDMQLAIEKQVELVTDKEYNSLMASLQIH